MKEIKQFDVIILGGGLAGIYTALTISSSLHVGLFVKDAIERGSSNLAQGGIAAEVIWDENKIEEHYEDTLRAGSYINDKEATHVLVEEAGKNIERLLSLGVEFDKNADGTLVTTLEGGHRSRRILHAGGDDTGAHIMQNLRDALAQRKNIDVYEDEMAIEILHNNNKALGVIVINQQNEEVYVLGNKIVLATGGIGGIYKKSTNEKIACGDGIAMAHRAGVRIKNMEFVQFHPTGFYIEDQIGKTFLISEAVRGEGGILKNIEGVRFMEKYDKERMELAPRDVVSQAIHREMFDTWSDHVYLDITHKSKDYLVKRFPTIYQHCLDNGIDISKDYIPVAPVEHFLCGGIDTDVCGHTSMENLYAIGECANTGVHGANRLASNSLLECIVFGGRVADEINQQKDTFGKIDVVLPDMVFTHKKYNFKDIRVEIRDVMSKYVFIVRKEEDLLLAKKLLTKHYNNLKKINVFSRYYYETINMVTVALLIIEQALARKESVGCHFRLD
ncbi:MAG: L-aspartate oxidase [Anaeroplasmataceae bacterium]|nr:L-aspartate oxidase [Anaeroplasmataceae bacterium]